MTHNYPNNKYLRHILHQYSINNVPKEAVMKKVLVKKSKPNKKQSHTDKSCTPLRIEDAQSASPSPLITARKAGVLNEKRRKKGGANLENVELFAKSLTDSIVRSITEISKQSSIASASVPVASVSPSVPTEDLTIPTQNIEAFANMLSNSIVKTIIQKSLYDNDQNPTIQTQEKPDTHLLQSAYQYTSLPTSTESMQKYIPQATSSFIKDFVGEIDYALRKAALKKKASITDQVNQSVGSISNEAQSNINTSISGEPNEPSGNMLPTDIANALTMASMKTKTTLPDDIANALAMASMKTKTTLPDDIANALAMALKKSSELNKIRSGFINFDANFKITNMEYFYYDDSKNLRIYNVKE